MGPPSAAATLSRTCTPPTWRSHEATNQILLHTAFVSVSDTGS